MDSTSRLVASGEVVITHKIGLHARPSVKLTKLAKTFQSAVRVKAENGANWVNAKSINRVMALKVPQGETLVFEAEGDDAANAIEALVGLVKRNFDEA